MTAEEAFEIFCQEANITEPITRELRVRPIFMTALKMCETNIQLLMWAIERRNNYGTKKSIF